MTSEAGKNDTLKLRLKKKLNGISLSDKFMYEAYEEKLTDNSRLIENNYWLCRILLGQANWLAHSPNLNHMEENKLNVAIF